MSLQDYDENPISYDNTLLHFKDIYGNQITMTVTEWENTPNYCGEDSSKMTAISEDGDHYELLVKSCDDSSDPAPSDPKYTLLHFTDIYGNELIMTVAEWENTPNYCGEDSYKMTAISDDGDQYDLLVKSV